MNDDRVDLFKTMLARTKGPKELAIRDYGKNGEFIINRLTMIDSQYDVLAADPGIAIHIDEFEEFIRTHGKMNSPWETRTAFRDFLGKKTVYRGVALTDKEFNDIVKYGMYPEYLVFRSDEIEKTMANNIFALNSVRTNMNFIKLLDEGSSLAIRRRVSNNTDKLLTLSVTDYPEVAFGFALSTALFRRKYNDDAHVYVFPIEAHVLDLIHFGETIDLPNHWKEISSSGSLNAVLYLTGTQNLRAIPTIYDKIKILEVPLSPAVESFTFLGFGPNELGKATKIDMAEYDQKFKNYTVDTNVNISRCPYGSKCSPDLIKFDWIRERYNLTSGIH